jgi:hypothetical protein
MVAAPTAGQAIGMVTVQKTRHSPAPSVLAAFSTLISTCSNPALADMYIRGKVMMTAVMTVAGQEKTIVVPNHEKNSPRGPLRPNNSSRPKPTTVGGKTNGNMKMPSIRFLPRPEYLAIHRAIKMPMKKVMTVVVRTVLHDIHSGARYESVISV